MKTAAGLSWLPALWASDFEGVGFGMKTRIRGADILTMNEKDEVVHGDLLIKDDRIVAVGRVEDGQVDREIDAQGKLILPGFIHLHVHLCQTLFRGRADDLTLLDWLRTRVWPLEAAHDEESIYLSALLGIGELLQSGTTTIVDMETVHYTDAAFRALLDSGIRALSGKVMMDFGDDVPPGLAENTDQSLQQSVDLLEKWHRQGGGRLRYAFAPRFVVSCTPSLLSEVRDLADEYGVYVHTHAAENKDEVLLVQERHGLRNVTYLDSIGLAHEGVILAHCVWLDEEEKGILAERGVHVAHCPSSNLKLASGVADVPDLLRRGVSVGLGADGAPCNNTLDMFHEMRLAALIHKPRYGATAMDARTVLRMATVEGARAVGLAHEIGSIETGKKADLVILDLNRLHTFPSVEADPFSRVVYSATRSEVDMVFVDGNMLVERGHLVAMDEEHLLREADRAFRRLLRRAGEE